jgi:predicted amidophosphoribosyltransferase
MSKYRCYTTEYKKPHHVLISWIQRRCVTCGQFIGKLRRKYCSSCVDKQSSHNNYLKHRQQRINSAAEYRRKHSKEYKIYRHRGYLKRGT